MTTNKKSVQQKADEKRKAEDKAAIADYLSRQRTAPRWQRPEGPSRAL